MEIAKFVDGLDLREGDRRRTSCPACHGHNTFTVVRTHGKLLWNCYKASCGLSGAKSKTRSLSELEMKVRNVCLPSAPAPDFVLPDHVLRGAIHPDVCAYVQEVHAESAEIWHDIREHRAVFVIRDPENGKMVGAVGRALRKGHVPKWKRYDKVPNLTFVQGPMCGVGVVVEDCASACAVHSAGYTGFAVLGTNISDSMIPLLRQFSEVIVALDNDASKKSIKLQKTLDAYVNSRVVFLADDLKYFSPLEVQAILSSSSTS